LGFSFFFSRESTYALLEKMGQIVHHKFSNPCWYINFPGYTTRKCTTAGAPETLTAGVFVFAGDLLAGGNPLPPAFFKSPVVSVVIPGAFLKSPAVLA
jgi:hypothetical protein